MNNEDGTFNYAKWEEYRHNRLNEYPVPDGAIRYDIELTDPQDTIKDCWHINHPHSPPYKTHYQCDHWYTITPIFPSVYPAVLGQTLDIDTFNVTKGILTRYGQSILAQGYKRYVRANATTVSIQPTTMPGVFYAPHKPPTFVEGTPTLRTIIQSTHPCHPYHRLNPNYTPYDKTSQPDYYKDCHQIEMHSTACRIECEPWGKNKQNHYAHFAGHYWTVSWIQPLQAYGTANGYPWSASPPREHSIELLLDWYIRTNHPEFNIVTHANNGQLPGGASYYQFNRESHNYVFTRILYGRKDVTIDVEFPDKNHNRYTFRPLTTVIEMADPQAFNKLSAAINELNSWGRRYVDA